ncbi:MAG TPA: PBP1A family penicillin-binding protein [Actinomycetota bacterium]
MTERSRRRRWLRRLLLAGLLLSVAFALFVAALYALLRIPQPSDLAGAQAVEVVDHQGRRIGRIHAGADRVSVPLSDVPMDLRNAVIATEDRTFYEHRGVAPTSILRAAFANLVARRTVQGGSTITQQYVKNAFVGDDRSVWRKTKEAVLALKLERQRSKDEILSDYLNTIYFGRGAYGVEAASRTYFGHSVKDLTLPQSALLAGMIQAPESYDPAVDADAARARRDDVLDFMVRDDFLTEREAVRAKRADVRVRKRRPGGLAPHFLEEVRLELEQAIGPSALYRGGVVVRVTLDRTMQHAAERAVRSVYDRRSDPEAALVAIDPATGAVRAMVGARNFSSREFDIAVDGRRQPGSTFKVAVLARALAEGIEPDRTYPAPATITIPTDSGPWKVANYDRASHGTLTIRRATELSVNTVFAQLIDDVGPDGVASVAEAMGIDREVPALHALALGSFEVTPLELTTMYATLAGRGVYHSPSLIERVVDAGGGTIFTPVRVSERTLARRVADETNLILQGVIENGTGASAAIGRPAAGKTGTTENFRDAWFAGYTRDLVAVVWNGYAGGRKTMSDVRGRSVTGGSFPAQMWAAFMREALEDVRPRPFPIPSEPAPSSTVVEVPSSSPPGGSPSSPPPSPAPSSPAPSPTPTATVSPAPTKTSKP